VYGLTPPIIGSHDRVRYKLRQYVAHLFSAYHLALVTYRTDVDHETVLGVLAERAHELRELDGEAVS
jgi:hypothetical protein